MDPLSVIVSAGAVSKGTFACVTVLGKFLGDTAVLDETVEALYKDVRSLVYMVAGTSSTLDSPSVRRHEESRLWEVVDSVLQDCDDTVQDLLHRLDSIHLNSTRKSNIAKDAWKQFRLDPREDEIKRFRGTFQYNCSALQTMLVTVSLYVSRTAPRMEADEIRSGFQQLERLLQDRRRNVLPINTSNEAVNRKHMRLRQATQQVASDASAILESHSSNCDESELNSTRARSDSKRKTTGSELDRPLDPDHRARISSWVPRKEAILEGPNIEPDESRDTEWTSTSESATLTASDDFASDDEELELKVAQKMLMKGRQSVKDEKLTQAEKPLRKALAEYQVCQC
ncbi:hypothetical protein B0A55_11630 [Friedmanniomyces simplex]|uniref:Fungal N-terminal domain-containing protein n=1 Tax=Friedmanniomyces simplex TaxID=329884 RepID=A0A4U0WA86_9PEZI|nr:hypothetical protein B0A55_11630 [Friedmanniomyces simplex]